MHNPTDKVDYSLSQIQTDIHTIFIESSNILKLLYGFIDEMGWLLVICMIYSVISLKLLQIQFRHIISLLQGTILLVLRNLLPLKSLMLLSVLKVIGLSVSIESIHDLFGTCKVWLAVYLVHWGFEYCYVSRANYEEGLTHVPPCFEMKLWFWWLYRKFPFCNAYFQQKFGKIYLGNLGSSPLIVGYK